MAKTQLRKNLNQEKWNKLLLKDASLWQVSKHVYRRYEVAIVYTLLALVFSWAILK